MEAKHKNKTLILLLILMLPVLFWDCEKLRYGNVIKKWYEPARTYMVFMPVMCGKSTIIVPYIMYDDQDWCIQVEGVGTKNNLVKQTYYVPKAQFDSLAIGSFLCVDGVCTEDTNNTKKRQ